MVKFSPLCTTRFIIIIIINIQSWAIWPDPSPELQFISIVSSVSQLFSFLVGCSGIILKGFGFVTFFAGVKASSFSIHLSCLVCNLSVVQGVWSLLFCGHKGFKPARGLNNFISAASILPLCKAVKVQFSDSYKNVGKTKVLYNFKIVSVLTFLKIVFLIVPINCKNFANLNSTSFGKLLRYAAA